MRAARWHSLGLVGFSVLFGAIIAVDGDTVDVDGATWRLTGFDAPETFRARCADEFALGLKAKARLEQLLADGPWAIVPAPGDAVDRYGRRLGRLTIQGGRDAGEVLVREGLARLYAGGRRKGWCP